MKENDRIIQKRYRRNLRRKALNLLGGKCIQCGFDDWRALHIDHVGSGGTTDTKGNPIKPQHDIIAGRNLEKYQLLCANCNAIKRYTHNEVIDDEYIPEMGS